MTPPPLLRQMLLFLLPPMLLLPSLPAVHSAASCNADDKRALLQFKKALGDPYTIITWSPDTDCCTDWYAMGCDPDTGRVTSIDISSSEAAGPLPGVVGDLPFLNTLTVRKSPNLTGPLPPELSKLSNLRMLWIDWNSLTGPVPAFLARLKKLEYINLSFNKFTGSIPPSLGDLPRLGALFLDRNQLTGSIPEALGRLQQESLVIRLGHNNLTGPIPKSFAALKISSIDLSRNKLTGDPSVLFTTGDWDPSITLFLDLNRNQFEFDLSNAKFSPTTAWLDLNHNRVHGTIPAQMTKLPLQNFNVSYNRLCGKIPQGGGFRRFTKYEFFHNKCLCGTPLPPCK